VQRDRGAVQWIVGQVTDGFPWEEAPLTKNRDSDRCAYRKPNLDVLMMELAEDWYRSRYTDLLLTPGTLLVVRA
jgi:hypothetical protein